MAETTPASYRALLAVPSVGRVLLGMHLALVGKQMASVALVLFTFFIVYQLHRYTLTHSVSLLLITVVDLVVIGLTWHEYRYLLGKRHRTA